MYCSKLALLNFEMRDVVLVSFWFLNSLVDV
jgi:hypothetical protein